MRAYLFAIARNLLLHERLRAGRTTELDGHPVDERPGPAARAESGSELRAVLAMLPWLPETNRAGVSGLQVTSAPVAAGMEVIRPAAVVHSSSRRASCRMVRTARVP